MSGFKLAKKPRQAPDRLVGDEKDGIIGAKEVDVFNTQQVAGLAGLFRLDVGPLGHEGCQFVGLRHFAAMMHLIADDLIMHARAVREDDTANIVAARGVMGHRPARLVENVGGMCADGQNT